MTATERFLKYVSISTPSDHESTAEPSTACQFNLARELEKEMMAMGFQNVRVAEKCFVYGYIPATSGMEGKPCLGLIAHMDTAPDFSGMNIKPQIIENYDGGDVELKGSGAILSAAVFPELPSLKGKTLITTDGTTLLGADDKAGVAEIMTACEELLKGKVPHGPVAVAFTPDEETGLGVANFDVEGFGADYAYTVDGGSVGEVSYENFNACEAVVEVKGLSVHPGSSKDTMINAALVAMEFNAALPAFDIPSHTENYEGFFHLTHMEGDVNTAKLSYIVRDHSATAFDHRKYQLRHITQLLNQRWGENTVTLHIREQYRNMREKIEPCFFLIDNAKKAWQAVGVEPYEEAVRGGTDGAQLCYRNLPCPNLGTGGYGFHGPFEHITAEDLELTSSMIVDLVSRPLQA